MSRHMRMGLHPHPEKVSWGTEGAIPRSLRHAWFLACLVFSGKAVQFRASKVSGVMLEPPGSQSRAPVSADLP